MQRRLGTIAIVTIILAFCANRAVIGASLPRFPKGTPYAEARQSLKALGYRLNVLPDSDAVSRDRCGYKPDSLAEPKTERGMNAQDDDTRCFPEMIACAGTGRGQCIYSWRRGKTLIDVFTTNGIPIVDRVRCRVNC